LRFPCFTKQWTNLAFNSIFDILSNNTLSRAELNYIDGEYKNIHYGDILIKFSAFTDIENREIPFINSKSIPKNSKDLLLKNGDVVFADTAEDYTVGKATEIGGIDNQKIIAGLHTIPCRPKCKFIQRYLGYYVNSPAYHNQLLPYIQGIKVSSISKSLIKQTTISYPDEEEQGKIVKLLSFIDNKILAQSKIIDNLQSQIKGIRHSIFSNYIDKLKTTTTGKLSDFLHEISIKNTDNKFTPIAVGKYGIRRREDIYSKELASDYSKNKVVSKDTLIIGMGSTQIDIGILLEDEDYCVSPAYTTYKIVNINPFYLNELLIEFNPILSKKYMIISSRQGKSVNKSEMLNHLFYIHPADQQDTIEQIFNCLYLKLQKEKDILSLYKKQKAYLLKNLFI